MHGGQANGAFVACGPPGFSALTLITLGDHARTMYVAGTHNIDLVFNIHTAFLLADTLLTLQATSGIRRACWRAYCFTGSLCFSSFLDSFPTGSPYGGI